MNPPEHLTHDMPSALLTPAVVPSAAVVASEMHVMANYVRDAELFQNHAREGFL